MKISIFWLSIFWMLSAYSFAPSSRSKDQLGIIFQKGYFKNGYNLSEQSLEKGLKLRSVSRMQNEVVQKTQVLTAKKYQELKGQFLLIAEALRAQKIHFRQSICQEPVVLFIYEKKDTFCLDSLTNSDRVDFQHWLLHVRQYVGDRKI